MTMAGWFKRVAAGAGTYRTLLELNNAGSGSAYFAMQWSDSNALIVTGNDQVDVAQAANFASEPAVGVWFYAALVGTGGPGVFATARWWNAAGVLQDTQQPSDPDAFNFTATRMEVGANNSDEFLNGLVAYVRVWDAQLTRAELEAEMRSLTIVRTANINTAFTGIGGSGTDVSGNGRNWTLVGTDASLDEPVIEDFPHSIDTSRRYGHLLVR